MGNIFASKKNRAEAALAQLPIHLVDAVEGPGHGRTARLRNASYEAGRLSLEAAAHGIQHSAYSFSKEWVVNLSVRAFSITVRTVVSGAPSGIWAWISRVTSTVAPACKAKCWTISSAILPASRPTRC